MSGNADFFDSYDAQIHKIGRQYDLKNLLQYDDVYDDRGYWVRFTKLKKFRTYDDLYGYLFLYEIQVLSNQIYFGVANAYLLRTKVDLDIRNPSIYNHRYSFVVESTIHSIYSYWNRIALFINVYLRQPFKKREVYLKKIVDRLMTDYSEIPGAKQKFTWILSTAKEIEALNRNEFAHNYSLLMQKFLESDEKRQEFLTFPDILLEHCNAIVDDIGELLDLTEWLDQYIES